MTTEKNASASASASSPEELAANESVADESAAAQPMANRFEGMTDDEIVALMQEEIARLTIEQARAVSLEKELREKEDPANRISYATEIFAAQQDKLRLGVEIELRQKKINRIRRGFAEGAGPVSAGVKNGFLF